MIELERITNKADIEGFVRKTAAQYIFDLVNALGLSEDEAASKAENDILPLLECDLGEHGHHFFQIRHMETGKMLGAAWVVVEPETKIAWIYYILIHKIHRRNGYGRATLKCLHRMFYELGCDQVNLYVYDHNTNAQALYRSLGYRTSASLLRLSPLPSNL